MATRTAEQRPFGDLTEATERPQEPEKAPEVVEDPKAVESPEERAEGVSEGVEPKFVLSLADGVDGPLAVAFPGSFQCDAADEDGRIVLEAGSGVEVDAVTARNADGAYGVEISEASA